MRTLLCALAVLSSIAVAEAQSGAPIHDAGRAMHRTGLKIRHRYRVTKIHAKRHWHATKAYVGHKARGVAKAIKD